MKTLNALLFILATCTRCKQVESNACAQPVSNLSITSCGDLTLQDSEGYYTIDTANGSVPLRCLYCARLPNQTGWWYRFGKGGMKAAWTYRYEWKASKLLTIIEQSDITSMSVLNISRWEVSTDVRFEITTSDSVNPTSATVQFTPHLTRATMSIPSQTGGKNTGSCILKFPNDAGKYDGSKILCSNQGQNKKCGTGNLPSNGQTTQSLFVEKVNIDPQGTGALARNGEWTRNVVYWYGSYYYVYVQESQRALVPVTQQTVMTTARASTQSSTRSQNLGSTATTTTTATSIKLTDGQTAALLTVQTPTSTTTPSTTVGGSTQSSTRPQNLGSTATISTTSIQPTDGKTSPTVLPTVQTPPTTTPSTPPPLTTMPTSPSMTIPGDVATTFISRGSTVLAASTPQTRASVSQSLVTHKMRPRWQSDLKRLTAMPVTSDSILQVSVQLSDLSQSNSFQMNNTSVLDVVSLLEQIAQTRSTNDTEVIKNIVRTTSSMLQAPYEAIIESQQQSKASSRISAMLENTVLSLVVSSQKADVQLKSPNIVAHRIAITNPEQYSTYNYSFYKGTDNNYFNSTSVLGKDNASDISPDVTVIIPRSVLRQAHGLLRRQWQRLPLGIIIYRNDTLFPTEKQHNDTYRINSNVVSVSFSNNSLTNLSEPVTITLQHTDKCGEEARCVFWQSTPSGEFWSDQGCVVVSTNSGATKCHCNHLTNFALLMNMDGPNRPKCLGKGDKLALSIITYVGCSLSLGGLVLSVLTLTIFPKQLENRPNKILINLCLALIGLIVVFWAGIDRTGNQAVCKAAGALIHYFTLSALLWMGIEAFNLYLLLVLVFSTDINHFILKCSIIGWGIPAVIVATTAGQSTDNYGGITYCHITHPAFIYALLTPAALILLANSISFGLVVRVMCRSARHHSSIRKDDVSSQPRAAFSLLVLMGLTWAFGFLTVSDVRLVFQYLFAIFNTTQGFFIFIFYCFRRKEMRQQWCVFLHGRGRQTVQRASQMTERRTTSTSMIKSKKISSSSLHGDVSLPSLHSELTTRSTSISMLMPSEKAKRKYSFKGMLGKFKRKDKEGSNSVGDILHELHRLEGSGLSDCN